SARPSHSTPRWVMPRPRERSTMSTSSSPRCATRRVADRVEVASVGYMYRQRLKTARGNDMVGEQWVFARAARPGARDEANKPDEWAGYGGERGARRPDDRRFGRNIVGLAQRGQCYVESLRRTFDQGFAPDRKRASVEQELTDLSGLLETARKNVD